MYINNVETSLRSEVKRLTDELHNYQLDLDDAKISRRELQQRLQDSERHREYAEQENDKLKVHAELWSSCRLSLAWTGLSAVQSIESQSVHLDIDRW